MSYVPSKGFVITISAMGLAFVAMYFVEVWRQGKGTAHRGGYEGEAIRQLRQLPVAQALFVDRERNRLHAWPPPPRLNLTDLASQNLIDPVLATGTRLGYVFVASAADATHWSATADPFLPGKTGTRYFFIDETGVIRFSLSGPATATSTAIEVP